MENRLGRVVSREPTPDLERDVEAVWSLLCDAHPQHVSDVLLRCMVSLIDCFIEEGNRLDAAKGVAAALVHNFSGD